MPADLLWWLTTPRDARMWALPKNGHNSNVETKVPTRTGGTAGPNRYRRDTHEAEKIWESRS